MRYSPEVVAVFNPKRLESAMQAKGYTAADLAFEMRNNSRLKTTESQVYKWLRGKHVPGGDAVMSAARACGVSVESLYAKSAADDDEEAALLRDIRHLPEELRLRIERVIVRSAAEAVR